MEGQADEDQHHYQYTIHSRWRAKQGDAVVRLPGKCSWPTGRHGLRCHSQNRKEQLLLCSRTSGYLEESAEVSSVLRIRTIADNKRRLYKRSRHSSIPVWGAFKYLMAREDPKRKTVAVSWEGIGGQAQTAGKVGARLDTPLESQQSATHVKFWPGIPGERGREASHATAIRARGWWSNKGWNSQNRSEQRVIARSRR